MAIKKGYDPPGVEWKKHQFGSKEVQWKDNHDAREMNNPGSRVKKSFTRVELGKVPPKKRGGAMSVAVERRGPRYFWNWGKGGPVMREWVNSGHKGIRHPTEEKGKEETGKSR